MATSRLSHAELVLLSLLAEGPAHGYELVQRVRSMEVERWARIAESTLYSVLRRMEERGWLEAEERPGARGRSRTTYRRTDAGRERTDELIMRGLSEPEPIHSDRLVAAVFAAATGREEAVEAGLADLARTRAALAQARRTPELSPYGRLLIDFRDRLAEAHEEALRGLGALAGRAGTRPPAPVRTP